MGGRTALHVEQVLKCFSCEQPSGQAIQTETCTTTQHWAVTWLRVQYHVASS